MRTATKAHVVNAVLVLAAVWPLVQMTLVLRWDLSPWKLAVIAVVPGASAVTRPPAPGRPGPPPPPGVT